MCLIPRGLPSLLIQFHRLCVCAYVGMSLVLERGRGVTLGQFVIGRKCGRMVTPNNGWSWESHFLTVPPFTCL